MANPDSERPNTRPKSSRLRIVGIVVVVAVIFILAPLIPSAGPCSALNICPVPTPIQLASPSLALTWALSGWGMGFGGYYISMNGGPALYMMVIGTCLIVLPNMNLECAPMG